MRALLVQKFDPLKHNTISRLLYNTGNAELIEGNAWGDKFWGVCDGEGENTLGKLLMEIRAGLRQFPLL